MKTMPAQPGAETWPAQRITIKARRTSGPSSLSDIPLGVGFRSGGDTWCQERAAAIEGCLALIYFHLLSPASKSSFYVEVFPKESLWITVGKFA